MAGVRDLLGRTERVRVAHQALEGLISLAFTDSTTGLPNRSALDEVTKLSFGFEEPGFGVAMIDLTGFKKVNDLGSHSAGDTALAQVGRTLLDLCGLSVEGSAQPGGLPFRYGGDEFCILLPATTFEAFVDRSNLGRLRWPDFSFEGKHLGFGASVGLAEPDEELGLTGLIVRADVAAKVSKQRGDEPVRWSPDLEQDEVVSPRRRCPSCSATVTIQVSRKELSPSAFQCCPNCGRGMAEVNPPPRSGVATSPSQFNADRGGRT